MAMDNQEYVQTCGELCPYCKSGEVKGHSLESVGSTLVLRGCACERCGSEWEEEFHLTGYEEIQR